MRKIISKHYCFINTALRHLKVSFSTWKIERHEESPLVRKYRGGKYVIRCISILIGIFTMGGALCSLSYAQVLGGRPSQTELQSATGSGVLSVCQNLTNPVNSEQRDLSARCTEMVDTVVQIDGGTGGTTSLGLSEEGLNAALQQVASEEVIAPRTMATKTFNGQVKNLSARLASLRLGAKGFSVTGLNINGLPQLADVSSNGIGLPGSALRGGGASGDADEFSRLSTFINGTFSTGDKETTDREDGFDFDSQGVTIGVDYRFFNELVLGTAFTYSHFDADFNPSSVNAGGGSDSDGYVFSLYGTYYIQNFYLEGVGSVGWTDHDARRKIVYASNTAQPSQNRTAKGNTHSTQYSFNVGTGYNAQVKNFDFGPYARLTYFNIDIDGFKETGAAGLNLQVEGQEVQSLISALGVRGSRSLSWEWGVWTPQIRVEWNHEYQNDAENISTGFVNDPNQIQFAVRTEKPDRDFFRVGGTLANVSQGGIQAFLDYETMLGFRDISNHIFTVGVRKEF